MFWIIPITPRQFACATLLPCAIAVGFCYVLWRYWAFYHLGVGGGFAFIFIIPLALVSSIVLTFGIMAVLMRRRISARRAVPAAIMLVTLAALALLASEFHATSAARSAEGLGAGDLSVVFRALITFR